MIIDMIVIIVSVIKTILLDTVESKIGLMCVTIARVQVPYYQSNSTIPDVHDVMVVW